MKKEIADKWCKALRSKKYKQTKGHLKDNVGHCCLGVLCRVLGIRPKRIADNSNIFEFCGEFEVLPERARILSGVSSFDGSYDGSSKCLRSLARDNDDDFSFEEIANIIQKHWEEL